MKLRENDCARVMAWRDLVVFVAVFLAAFIGGSTLGVPGTFAQAQTTGAAKSERVLVVGASGRTGRLIVAELQARKHQVRGLTRNAERAKGINPAVEWVVGDLREPATLRDIVKGVDRIVFAAGSAAFRDPTNIPEKVEFRGMAELVDLGIAAKVKHFTMMSSGGVGHADPSATEGFAGVMRWKSDAERYLRKSGLSYTVVRAGGLDDRPGRELGIGLAQGDAVFANLMHVSRADVASVIVESLFNPDASGKTFEMYNGVTNELTDWKEGLARLKKTKRVPSVVHTGMWQEWGPRAGPSFGLVWNDGQYADERNREASPRRSGYPLGRGAGRRAQASGRALSGYAGGHLGRTEPPHLRTFCRHAHHVLS